MNLVMPRLGVNIDHVATLREARGEKYPSVVDAARVALSNGADQITIHLREDRRHIQDTDVEAVHLVTKSYGKPLNLEIGSAPEIIDIAIATRPEWICLVPENRQERTTEGGLNLLNEASFKRIQYACERLRSEVEGIKISLFVESDIETLKKCAELKADAVEIHTGDYARAFLDGEDYNHHLESYRHAHEYCRAQGLGFHAGHGLTDESTRVLLNEGLFVEYNIGHWIIAQSTFEGLSNVVGRLKADFVGE